MAESSLVDRNFISGNLKPKKKLKPKNPQTYFSVKKKLGFYQPCKWRNLPKLNSGSWGHMTSRIKATLSRSRFCTR